MIDRQELDRLEKLLADGTPGPWRVRPGSRRCERIPDVTYYIVAGEETWHPVNGSLQRAGEMYSEDEHWVTVHADDRDYGTDEGGVETSEDAALIVAAVNALPALVQAAKERERAVWRGQNLTDGIGMEREMRQDAQARAEAAERREATLRKALSGLLARYTEIVASGDCGFWDVESESEVFVARAALAAAAPEQPERRLAACVEKWPECVDGGYDPRCCRFPKSCSCQAVPEQEPGT